MHFCADEIMAICALIPGLVMGVRWFRGKAALIRARFWR